MMVYDAFAKRVMCTNKLIFNNLTYNMIFSLEFIKNQYIAKQRG